MDEFLVETSSLLESHLGLPLWRSVHQDPYPLYLPTEASSGLGTSNLWLQLHPLVARLVTLVGKERNQMSSEEIKKHVKDSDKIITFKNLDYR